MMDVLVPGGQASIPSDRSARHRASRLHTGNARRSTHVGRAAPAPFLPQATTISRRADMPWDDQDIIFLDDLADVSNGSKSPLQILTPHDRIGGYIGYGRSGQLHTPSSAPSTSGAGSAAEGGSSSGAQRQTGWQQGPQPRRRQVVPVDRQWHYRGARRRCPPAAVRAAPSASTKAPVSTGSAVALASSGPVSLRTEQLRQQVDAELVRQLERQLQLEVEPTTLPPSLLPPSKQQQQQQQNMHVSAETVTAIQQPPTETALAPVPEADTEAVSAMRQLQRQAAQPHDTLQLAPDDPLMSMSEQPLLSDELWVRKPTARATKAATAKLPMDQQEVAKPKLDSQPAVPDAATAAPECQQTSHSPAQLLSSRHSLEQQAATAASVEAGTTAVNGAELANSRCSTVRTSVADAPLTQQAELLHHHHQQQQQRSQPQQVQQAQQQLPSSGVQTPIHNTGPILPLSALGTAASPEAAHSTRDSMLAAQSIAATGGHSASTAQPVVMGFSFMYQAARAEPLDVQVLAGCTIPQINFAIKGLGKKQELQPLQALVRYALGREDCNQHTYAAVFCALATAGRMDLVVREWDALSRARIDIGPVGASGLIKACCVRRDVGLALRLFDQLLRRRVTFNRYAYNCLVHLCAVMGRCDDALAVYNLMRLECDEESLPDLYTYSALVRAVLVTNRLEMAQQIYENMLEDGIVADAKLWTHYITAAARAQNVRLAASWHAQMLRESKPRSPPNMCATNALISAYARCGDMAGAKAVLRREVLGKGARPDEHTLVALLTGAARSNQPLAEVEATWAMGEEQGVRLNSFVGTALIQAYRRSAHATKDVREKERGLQLGKALLVRLAHFRQLSPHALACQMAFCMELGHAERAWKLAERAEEQWNVLMTPDAWEAVAKAAEDAGLLRQAALLRDKAQALAMQLVGAGDEGNGE